MHETLASIECPFIHNTLPRDSLSSTAWNVTSYGVASSPSPQSLLHSCFSNEPKRISLYRSDEPRSESRAMMAYRSKIADQVNHLGYHRAKRKTVEQRHTVWTFAKNINDLGTPNRADTVKTQSNPIYKKHCTTDRYLQITSISGWYSGPKRVPAWWDLELDDSTPSL